MTEGTKSVLIGAHSAMHSFQVFRAWRRVYGKYPKLWQTVCIALHDIGYWGRNYLSEMSNDGHAEVGARIARALFGERGWRLVAGHSTSSQRKFGISPSELELPDDVSWLISPIWWLRINVLASEIFLQNRPDRNSQKTPSKTF